MDQRKTSSSEQDAKSVPTGESGNTRSQEVIEPAPSLEEEAPIFIGGAGRSGTTLVRTILAAHPRIAIGPELKVIPHIAKQWRHVTRLGPYLSRNFGLTAEEVDRAFSDAILKLLRSIRKWSDAPRLGEKTPGNVFVFPHLHRLFPDSPLINVIRDGRDVVRSLLSCENWANPRTGDVSSSTESASQAAKYWRSAVMSGMVAEEKLSDTGCILTVRYEELVTQPEAVVRKICTFIDEPWNEAMIRIGEFDDHPFFEGHRPIGDGSVGRWREELTESQKKGIKEVAGDLLVELGYAEDQSW